MNQHNQNPPLTENGRTNHLDLPEAEYAQLNTQDAFARFNARPKKRLGLDGSVHPIIENPRRKP